MPTCFRCSLTLPSTDFYASVNARGQSRLGSYCKECTRSSVTMWRRANRARVLASDRIRYLKRTQGEIIRRRGDGNRHHGIRAFLNWCKELPCTDCAQQFPAVCMDFDHVRGEKRFFISEMHGRAVPDEEWMAELQKCEVVCSNCHRLRSARRIAENKRRGRRPAVRINLLAA